MNIQYDIYAKKIILPSGDEMPVNEFKQMAFERGMEGVLFQIAAIEQAEAEAFKKVYLPKFEKFLKEQSHARNH